MANVNGNRRPVFRDPVHGLIHVSSDDGYIIELIDTPVFQRLRRVRQLGLSYLTFHGAEHSRFAHSIGVFNFAQRILAVLQERYRSNSEVFAQIEKYSKTVKAAALLHDIGHGPFSHVSERAFSISKHHEVNTQRLITDKKSGIPDILTAAKIEVSDVTDIISGTFEPKYLQDIVSSQLDADRMDYLLRDGAMTGVKYGEYDPDWILNSLCLGKEPGSRPIGTGAAPIRLCLDDKRGISAAEQLITARMHMTFQVYFHKNTRRWEAHVLALLNEAAAAAGPGKLPKRTPEAVRLYLEKRGQGEGDHFLRLDDMAVITAMQEWANSTETPTRLRALSADFLNRRRRFEREIVKLGASQAMELQKAMDMLGEQNAQWLFDDITTFEPYKDYLSSLSKKGSDPGFAATKAILASSGDPDAPATPVEATSPLFKALAHEDAKAACAYLFFEKSLAGQVREAIQTIARH